VKIHKTEQEMLAVNWS